MPSNSHRGETPCFSDGAVTPLPTVAADVGRLILQNNPFDIGDGQDNQSLLTSAATETLAAGTFIALLPSVLIAIPVLQERISPVLDTAARLLLITRQRGKEVARREFVLNPLPLEGLARSVAELRVDVLLCAALSEPLLRALERRGVRVKPHLCGEVESVLRAFDCGQLRRDEFRMPGCCHRRRVARNNKSSRKEIKTET